MAALNDLKIQLRLDLRKSITILTHQQLTAHVELKYVTNSILSQIFFYTYYTDSILMYKFSMFI